MTSDPLVGSEEENISCGHYQLQGTWTTSSRKNINYLVLKESLGCPINDISRIYFNVDDVRLCDGSRDVQVENGCNERIHINLLDLILEFPTSEIVCEIFKEFLVGLQPLASVLVSQKLAKTRLVESKVPKIQLKIDEFDDESVKVEDEKCSLANDTRINGLQDAELSDICHSSIGEQFSLNSPLKETHRYNAEEGLECTSIHLKFGNKSGLLNHVKNGHSTKTRTFLKCEKCQKSFHSKKAKQAHFREHHKVVKKKTIEERPAALMCPTCGEKKNSEHNLAQHIKKFHENAFPEPIVCNLCTETKQLRNRKYHTPYSYNLHLRQIHRLVILCTSQSSLNLL